MQTSSHLHIVAALPVRSFSDGKQRLRSVLAMGQRAALIKHVVGGVLQALAQSSLIQARLVISGDDAVLAWAEEHGAVPVHEAAPGLNVALTTAAGWAKAHSATALLTVLPDLPLLTASDVQHLIQQFTSGTVVVAPDRHGTGTNALLVPLPAPFPFQFGPDSFARHQASARAVGLRWQRITTPGWAYDLDTPADLAALPREHALWAALGDVEQGE